MNKKISLTLISILLICSIITVLPITQASSAVAYYVDWSVGNYDQATPSAVWNAAQSAKYETFSATINQGYLEMLNIQMKKSGNPDGYLRMRVEGTSGYNQPPNGTVLETSNNAVAISSIGTEYSILSFTFDGTLYISNSQYYAMIIYVENATLIDGTTNKIILHLIYPASGGAGYSGTWLGSDWSTPDAA